MAKPTKLYRTTIVIWSEEDPSEMEIADLVREATNGNSYCSSQKTVLVEDEGKFPTTEFFDDNDA